MNRAGDSEARKQKMRTVWILVASALLAFANFVKSQDTARNLYSSRYDNLDIDTILGSSRLVNNYVDCLLSRKPCPPEGKDLKRILPEALRTKCARCSATQKENALKIITTLYYQYPEQYMALRERWDPSGEYHRRFEEYIAGLQFNQIGSNGNDRPRPTVGTLGNRFGGEDPSTASGSSAAEFGTTAPSPAATVRPTTRPTTRPVVRQTTSRIVTPRPTPNRFGGGFGATNNQNNPNASPFVGLFNSIGNKLATTADAIAGMLRRTVDVLVSTHLQAHQQRRSVRSN